MPPRCNLVDAVAQVQADLVTMRRIAMKFDRSGPMDFRTIGVLATMWFLTYSAWLTSIVFCSANSHRALLIAGATFFPIGVVDGVRVWFGGW
jgi:hypothetical protein